MSVWTTGIPWVFEAHLVNPESNANDELIRELISQLICLLYCKCQWSLKLPMWACPCSNKILQWGGVGLCVCFLSGFTTPRGSFTASPPPCVGFLHTIWRESPRGYLSSPSDGLSVLSAFQKPLLDLSDKSYRVGAITVRPLNFHFSSFNHKGNHLLSGSGRVEMIRSVAPPGRKQRRLLFGYVCPLSEREPGIEIVFTSAADLDLVSGFWLSLRDILVTWIIFGWFMSVDLNGTHFYIPWCHHKDGTCRLVGGGLSGSVAQAESFSKMHRRSLSFDTQRSS